MNNLVEETIKKHAEKTTKLIEEWASLHGVTRKNAAEYELVVLPPTHDPGEQPIYSVWYRLYRQGVFLAETKISFYINIDQGTDLKTSQQLS